MGHYRSAAMPTICSTNGRLRATTTRRPGSTESEHMYLLSTRPTTNEIHPRPASLSVESPSLQIAGSC